MSFAEAVEFKAIFHTKMRLKGAIPPVFGRLSGKTGKTGKTGKG
ncbi:MAG TPA: hypothetical protein VJY34_12705 [Roseiarcus sp.]|nr:hypothetical protein [Roseiarcus sp.]